jgi:hypothetical protein
VKVFEDRNDLIRIFIIEQLLTESGPKDSSLLVFYSFWSLSVPQVSRYCSVHRALPACASEVECYWPLIL